MSSLDDPERAAHYREILPAAYTAAAAAHTAAGKKGLPTPLEVGQAARGLLAAEYEKSLPFRMAMSFDIYAEIIDVRRESLHGKTSDWEGEYFVISYRELRDADGEVQEIRTPFLNDFTLGQATRMIWDRFDENGRNEWVGKRMRLLKHNDEAAEGDKAKNGYRRVVFAEPL